MTTETLLEWHEAYLEEIKDRGELDGKMNQPHFEDKILSPFEKKIKANYRFKAAGLKNSYFDRLSAVNEDKENALRAELEVIKGKNPEQRILAAKCRRDTLIKEEKDRNAAEMKTIENTPSFVKAKSTLKSVARSLKKKKAELEREYTDKKLHTVAYAILMFFIAVGEVAFNFAAFEDIIGDNKFFSLISAISVNSGLVLLFHFIGDFLKRRKEIKNSAATVSILSLICLIVIAVMAELRGELLLFGSIGIMLMAVGVAMSWLSHDSSNEFYSLLKDEKKAIDKLKKEELEISKVKKIENDRWAEAKETIEGNFKSYEEHIKKAIESKQQEIDALIVGREAIHSEYEERKQEINSLYHVAVQSYREENYEHRNDSKQPIVWGDSLDSLNI